MIVTMTGDLFMPTSAPVYVAANPSTYPGLSGFPVNYRLPRAGVSWKYTSITVVRQNVTTNAANIGEATLVQDGSTLFETRFLHQGSVGTPLSGVVIIPFGDGGITLDSSKRFGWFFLPQTSGANSWAVSAATVGNI